MDINELYKTYKEVADRLFIEVEDQTDNQRKSVSFGEIVKQNDISINRYGLTKPLLTQIVANIYCDAEEAQNEYLRDKSYAALICLYWYKVHEWARTSQSLGLDYIEFGQHWLPECINDALYYRSWRPLRIDHEIEKKEHRVLYIQNPQYRPEDPVAADRSINHFCSCKRAKEYQASNKQKRSGNFNTISVDDSYDEDGHSMLDRNEVLAVLGPQLDIIGDIIQTLFIDKNLLVEGLIVDLIANSDSYKTIGTPATCTIHSKDRESGKEVEEEFEYTKYTSEFDPRRLVKIINNLDSETLSRFSTKYGIKDEKSFETELKSLPNPKLYKKIQTAVVKLKSNPEVISSLQNN